MPLFEYVCEACQIKFEKMQSSRDKNKETCPECGLEANRVMSVNHHTFGWRLTDRSHERFGPRDEMERDV